MLVSAFDDRSPQASKARVFLSVQKADHPSNSDVSECISCKKRNPIAIRTSVPEAISIVVPYKLNLLLELKMILLRVRK